MSLIITKGYAGNLIITKGYGVFSGLAEVLRLTSLINMTKGLVSKIWQ
jgi:hypothetical protein